MDDLLQVINDQTIKYGSPVDILMKHPNDPKFLGREVPLNGWRPKPSAIQAYSASAAQDTTEFHNFFVHLKKKGYLNLEGELTATITAEGITYLDTIAAKRTQSEQAFVAMWFDAKLDPAYEAIRKAIEDYNGYKALRIDKYEHANQIVDELLAQIRSSKFTVADFTHGEKGARGGVYFEAGFALGLGLPVIWTARKDMLGDEPKIHFDLQQYNMIVWENPEELRDKLAKRIRALVGQGPLKVTEEFSFDQS